MPDSPERTVPTVHGHSTFGSEIKHYLQETGHGVKDILKSVADSSEDVLE